MIDWLPLTHWHWLTIAVLLFMIEVMSFTTYFLWIGIAATLTGLLLWLFPGINWMWQSLCFSLFSLCVTGLGLTFFKKIDSTESTMNQRNRQYIGREFTLQSNIVNGRGSVRVDDSIWRVAGDNLPAGTTIKVVDVDGPVLIIEKVEAPKN